MAHGQCSGKLEPNQTKYCTLLFNDIPPRSIVSLAHSDSTNNDFKNISDNCTETIITSSSISANKALRNTSSSSLSSRFQLPSFITSWGSFGSDDGEFKYPQSVAVDTISGSVYVVDYQNNRVEKFTEDGTFLTKFDLTFTNDNGIFACLNTDTSSSSTSRSFSPSGVAVDATTGNVYISDSGTHQIPKLDNRGRLVSKWGSFGSDDGQFAGLLNIAVSSESKTVYIADGGNSKIQEFTRSHLINNHNSEKLSSTVMRLN